MTTTTAFSGTMEVKRPSIFGHRWKTLHGELAAAAGGGVELRLFARRAKLSKILRN